jgi:hypothetical protein
MNVKTQEADSTALQQESMKKSVVKYVLDAGILLVMCGLLYFGASWQIFKIYTDAAKYECYAVAFWQGVSALQSFPEHQCDNILHPDPTIPITTNTALAEKMQQYGFPQPLVQFAASQSPDVPFHSLPREYPFLNLIPFSLALLVPAYWYQVAFAFLMAVVAVIIYAVLTRFRSRRAAIACALYLVTGCWGTALGRFDLVPAALTLFAVVCAVRKQWNWAFMWLAWGTLFKFYPVILLPPFLLAQQMEVHKAGAKWTAWRRWQPLGLFAALCVVVMSISLLLSVGGTIDQVRYFGDRPVQVESLSASLIWIVSRLTHHTLVYGKTFGSLNILNVVSLASKVSLLGTLLLGAGLLYTYWLQWRGKIQLGAASLLTLLIVMITGKVFSPQYLIWVAPLVAYVGEADLKWLLPWSVIGLLTTWIYPNIYIMTPRLSDVPLLQVFFPVATVRNFLLLGFILALLIYYTRAKRENKMDGVRDDHPGTEQSPQISVAQDASI